MSGLSAARASAACGGRLRVGVRSEDRTKTRIINPPGRSTYLSEKAVRTSETTVGGGLVDASGQIASITSRRSTIRPGDARRWGISALPVQYEGQGQLA